jgi:aerotolerance regulator-like protein
VIRWTIPWAFAGLALVAGPILVHMLRRRNARRVVFPTTRFLLETRAAAVRFRTPSDVGLLILRAAIVVAAVLAAAQPVLLAAWRTKQWDRRVARAVVVDESRSRLSAAPDVEPLIRQELDAFVSSRFAGSDLREQVARASEWLARTPPARRELVILSDFQRGAIDARTIDAVPGAIGVRFIRAGVQPQSREIMMPRISGWRGSAWQPSATLQADRVDARWTRVEQAAPPTWLTTSQPDADTAAAARALAAAASFGVPPVDDKQRITVAFGGAPSTAGAAITTPWMLGTMLALRQSGLLRESGALVVRTEMHASSPAAPAIVRAVMLAASRGDFADRELEVVTIPDVDLAAWRRDSAPVSAPGNSVASDGSEARVLWAAALILLGIETWLRRRAGQAQAQEDRHAHAA